MLFHPKTLELLYHHKLSGTDTPSLDLLALLTDYTSFIKIDDLFSILYSYTEQGDIDMLERTLITHARAASHAGLTVCVWLGLSREVEEVILQNRTGRPRRLCFTSPEREPCNFVSHLEHIALERAISLPEANVVQVGNDSLDELDTKENLKGPNQDAACRCAKKKRAKKAELRDLNSAQPTSEMDDVPRLPGQADWMPQGGPIRTSKKPTMKQPIQTNTLNFQRTETKRAGQIGRFVPVDLSCSTFVYDRGTVKLDTLRRRDDLRQPIRLQFIKHYDQRRPPIYRPRGVVIRNPYSYKRMKEIISYDNDSSEEWEMCDRDSAVDIGSTDISESSDGTDTVESMVSDDSTNSVVEEPKRRLKKPVFLYNRVPQTVYFDVDKYSNAPLRLSSCIPPSIHLDLNKLKNEGLSTNRIAELYNVEEDALARYYGSS